MNQKVNRSEIIPEIGTAAHRILISEVFKTQPFKESIQKGRPFFTEADLDQIEEKYPDGMTWKEIEQEISKKGLIFKKPTFRKYIQNKWIHGPFKKQEKHGSELKYPSSIVREINFVKFLLSEDGEKIKNILGILIDMFGQDNKYGDKLYDILEDKVTQDFAFSLRTSIYDFLTLGNYTIIDAVRDIDDSIYENQEHKNKLEEHLEKISDLFNKHIEPEVDSFIKYTEENSVKINFDKYYYELIKKFM